MIFFDEELGPVTMRYLYIERERTREQWNKCAVYKESELDILFNVQEVLCLYIMSTAAYGYNLTNRCE